MSDIGDIAKENCRTCLTHFNENNEKCSLMDCLAMNFDDGQIELMKKVMATCSVTLFSEKEDETVSDEVFVCMPCVTEIDQMLNFLQKCIHSEVILKHASQVKTEASSVWIDDGQEQKETGIQAKVEGFHRELVAVSSQTTTEPPSENPKHEQCHRKFSSPLKLSFPKYRHSGHKPHTCIICNENFKTQQLIKRHMVAEHEDTHSREYLCGQCSKVFPSKYYLNLHKLKIHSVRKYSCSVCKLMFASVSSLKFHENIHIGKQIHSCSSGSKSFVGRSVLKKHVNSFQSFRCHCGRSSNGEKKPEVHVESVHEEKDKSRKYSCPNCDKKFQRPYSLKDHVNSHLGVKPFLCNACGSAFTALSNLTSHIKRIHPVVKKPAVKKFLCQTCGNSFARAAHLKRHTLRKHVPNPEKNHECPICKKKFLEKSDVTGHVKLHEDVKPFVCEQCSKGFRTGWRLQAHIKRVHLGLRPFECPSCSLKFKTKCNLEKHIRTHTGEKPFPCPHCNYTCAEKSNLKKHINKHLKMM